MKLFIPLLCYNRTAHVSFMMSIMRLVLLLKDRNISATVYPITFESLVSRGRNAAAAHMLTDPTNTHLLFVDSDIEFDPQDVIRLLDKDKPVIVGTYPQKYLSIPKTQQVLSTTPLPDDPLRLCTNIPEQRLAPGTPGDWPETDGMIEVEYATTGFMLIKREVFDALIQRFPESKYVNDIDGYGGASPDSFYNFFPSIINPATKKFESEDFGFCRLWRECGGKIHILTDVNLSHTGWFDFKSNLARQREFFGASSRSPAGPP